MPQPTPRRGCPVCAATTIYTHCPDCRAKGIIIGTLTLYQLREKAKRLEAGRAGVERAIAALEEEK